MCEPSIADQYFIRNDQFGVAICHICEYAVMSREIISHLINPKGVHRITRRVAQQVFAIIDKSPEWIEVQDDHDPFPTSIDHPVPGLTVYQDGLKCMFPSCSQIYRSANSLRVHWSKEHRFSAYGHRGQPRPSEAAAGQVKREESIQHVVCQRVFRGGIGSHYIQVRQPGAAYEPTTPVPPASQVAHAVDEVEAIPWG
jgi:hypothetical protein